MTHPMFGGDKKVGASILSGPEKALVAWGTPRVPGWLETYHLTMMTVLWSGLNVVFGYLGRENLHWLWAVSLMIVVQYVTDLFDGAVGRTRNTGLIKWGFYMDHFLDYIFLCSLVVAGYLIAPPEVGFWYVVLVVLVGGFMVNSFLTFAATNQFEIYFYGMGPTEMRIGFILLNAVIIFTGTDHFPITVPLVCGICGVGLVFMAWKSSRTLWAIDMEHKAEMARGQAEEGKTPGTFDVGESGS